MSSLFWLERNKKYKELCILYLQKYRENPELSMYIDGFLRCFRKLKFESLLELDNEFKDFIIEILGYIPQNNFYSNKIAFIDHSHHAKTLSSMFFVEWMKLYAEVDVFWSHSWRGLKDSFIEFVLNKYETVVFWQVFPEPDFRFSFQKNVFIVPMWDAVYCQPSDYFLAYRNCKFICFCKRLSDLLSSFGIQNFYLKAPPPNISGYVEENVEFRALPTVFFWPRTKQFQWQELRTIINPKQIDKIIVLLDPDPDNPAPNITDSDVKAYNIEFIYREGSRRKYLQILCSCDIYVCPRLYEGIGFSFLDAMACGCVPIANNQPTMNEYINEEIGYLIDYKEPNLLDLSNFRSKQKKLEMYLTTARAEWSFSCINLHRWMFCA